MKKKIKVLHIIPSFGPGGAERLLIDLLESFDDERFEVAALSLYRKTGKLLEKEIDEKEFNVFFLDKRLGLDLRMFPKIYRFLCSYRPDVVHTHLGGLRYGLIPMILSRVPVRVHTVHSLAQKEVKDIVKVFHWVTFRLGGVVPVSVSAEVARTVKMVYGKSIKTPIIYNGIRVSKFTHESSRQGSEKEGIILLHIGRFEPQKNHLLLIKAFSLVINELPNTCLWLVGDGPLRPSVENALREYGLQDKVTLKGLCENISGLLAASDLFILSSDCEGLPLTILEAMAAGKPVVATKVGGVPEIVEDGITGILVPPNDPQKLAKAILYLVQNPGLRKRMGEKARERVVQWFDIAVTANAYESLYLELLKLF